MTNNRNTGRPTSKAWIILLFGDCLALLAFVLVGQLEHGTLTLADPLATMAPLIIPLWTAWIGVSQLMGVGPTKQSNVGARWMIQSLVAWLAAAPLALVLRALWLGHSMIATSFVISGLGFGGLFLLAWRLAYVFLRRRRFGGSTDSIFQSEDHGTARNKMPDPTRQAFEGRKAMLNPYFIMSGLFVTLAAIVALDNALDAFSLLAGYPGLGWLRVHFITLGAVSEALFGFLPSIVADRNGSRGTAFRWETWLTLNAGFISLVIGIPLVDASLIITGGTLVFVAVLLLMRQLRQIDHKRPVLTIRQGSAFYLAGFAYLLLGIIIGTGLWLGWGEVLRIAVPIEVHIHANSWGFMALVLAGLMIDLYPQVTKRQLEFPGSVGTIFWLLVLGALGLVLGPWIPSTFLTVVGILLHSIGTIWLLISMILPLRGKRWSPGHWHMISSYLWFFAPVLVAPLILAKVPGFPGAGIEESAPQALIYGWLLQFGIAFLPFFFKRLLLPDQGAELGGSWLSLFAIHLGGLIFWIGIFLEDIQGLLHGSAYLLWLIALFPLIDQLWAVLQNVDYINTPAAAADQQPSIPEDG